MTTINRFHKDRVFIDLFGLCKENALSLYNALNGTDYKDTSLLEIVTMTDAIYMKMKNDVSFMLNNKVLGLWEEQSSFNPNMPLRGLMYFADQYEGYVAKHKYNIYGTRLIKLPTPQFVVFYLGPDDEKIDDCMELRLSDAFEIPDRGCLEVVATMYNLNGNRNSVLKQKCKVLCDYTFLMCKIREFNESSDLENAITDAVNYCIEHDVLAEYLLKHKAEVMDMLLTEYNEVETMESFKDEARDEMIDLIAILSPEDWQLLMSCKQEQRKALIKKLKQKYNFEG